MNAFTMEHNLLFEETVRLTEIHEYATIGSNFATLSKGCLALVPKLTPHDLTNVG